MEIAECKTYDSDCNVYSISSYTMYNTGKTCILVSATNNIYLHTYDQKSNHLETEKMIFPASHENICIHSSYSFSCSDDPFDFYWIFGIITAPKIEGHSIQIIKNGDLIDFQIIGINFIPLSIKHVFF